MSASCNCCKKPPPPTITCLDCCSFFSRTPPFKTVNVLVDLGGGGWTDLECESCTLVKGEITLTPRQDSSGACVWSYCHPNFCTANCVGTRNFSLRVSASISVTWPPPQKCFWRVAVTIIGSSVPASGGCGELGLDDDDRVCATSAEFTTAPEDPTVLDCAETGPTWTLVKTKDISNPGGTVGICSGSLPTQIELTLDL